MGNGKTMCVQIVKQVPIYNLSGISGGKSRVLSDNLHFLACPARRDRIPGQRKLVDETLEKPICKRKFTPCE